MDTDAEVVKVEDIVEEREFWRTERWKAQDALVNLRATMGERIFSAEKIARDVMGERDALRTALLEAVTLLREHECDDSECRRDVSRLAEVAVS